MSIYVSKEITVTLAGTRLVEVECEKCATRFAYHLTRTGAGTGSAPYYLFQAAATRRAQAAAEKNLAKRLAEEAELVPCPKCNWVNEDAVRRQRRRVMRRTPWIAGAATAAAVLLAPIVGLAMSTDFGPRSRVPTAVAILIAGGGIFASLLLLAVRRSRQRQIDPNLTYPRRPQVPPGTPPALTMRRDPQTGQIQLVPVTPAVETPQTAGEPWAILRNRNFTFPPVCCVCLDPATRPYTPLVRASESSDLPIPTCDRCFRRCRGGWWQVLANVIVAMTLVAALVAWLVPARDHTGRWTLFTLIAVIGGPVPGMLFANWWVRPYRLRTVDADRGVLEFKARNPDYTRLMIAMNEPA